MSCNFQSICPFYRKKYTVDEAKYKLFSTRYCTGDDAGCAVYQVIDGASFLAVPTNLMPDQSARVYQILSNSIYTK